MGNILVNGTQNELVVATDCRGTQILIGDTTFILPGFTELQVWDLNIFTVKTESIDVISKLGIKVCMSSVAQISIQAFTDQARTSVDEDAILRAHVFMYGKHTDAEIRAGKGHDMPELAREEIATIMEGHQRSIIGSLTVEELRSDPKKVQELVRKIVTPDLHDLGFNLVSYQISDLSDNFGYMDAQGVTKTAAVEANAEIGEAKNFHAGRINIALTTTSADMEEAKRKAERVIGVNREAIINARAEAELAIKRAHNKKEVDTEDAKAEAAGQIQDAIQQIRVVRANAKSKLIKAKMEIDIAQKEIEKYRNKLVGETQARLMEIENEASGIKVMAEAAAMEMTTQGVAESKVEIAQAKAILAKGLAEAEVLKEKAESMKSFGESAIVELIVKELPNLAQIIAKPLESIDELVIVTSDGSIGSNITGDAGAIMKQIPNFVAELTGKDVVKAVQAAVERQRARAQ